MNPDRAGRIPGSPDEWLCGIIAHGAALGNRLLDQYSPNFRFRELNPKEGSESVTNCHRLKLEAADGKKYLMLPNPWAF